MCFHGFSLVFKCFGAKNGFPKIYKKGLLKKLIKIEILNSKRSFWASFKKPVFSKQTFKNKGKAMENLRKTFGNIPSKRGPF